MKDINKLKQIIAIIPTTIFLITLTLSINTNGKNFFILLSIGVFCLFILFILGYFFKKPKRKNSYSPNNNFISEYEIIKKEKTIIPTKKDLFFLLSDYNVEITNDLLDYYIEGLEINLLPMNYQESSTLFLSSEEKTFIKNVYNCLNNWSYIDFLLKNDKTIEDKYINNYYIPMDMILYIAFRKPIYKEYIKNWKSILYKEIENSKIAISKMMIDYEITAKESCEFLSRITEYKIPSWAFEIAYEKEIIS